MTAEQFASFKVLIHAGAIASEMAGEKYIGPSPPVEASLSKHIAECEAQNEELRRIVRWYMRHSGVDIPEEMQAIFNKISGVNHR